MCGRPFANQNEIKETIILIVLITYVKGFIEKTNN